MTVVRTQIKREIPSSSQESARPIGSDAIDKQTQSMMEVNPSDFVVIIEHPLQVFASPASCSIELLLPSKFASGVWL
jgi:hypothetical protein